MAYEIVKWIFNDGEKADADYKGILMKPYTNFSDVSNQLQKLREKGLAKGDKRLDSFLGKVDVFSITAPYNVSEEISKNNKAWEKKITDQINGAKTLDDIGEIKEDIKAEKGNYEDNTVKSLEAKIKEAESKVGKSSDVNKLEKIISRAKTKDDLRDIPSMGEVKRTYGEEARRNLSSILADKLNQLDSEEEAVSRDISDRIDRARSLSDLDRINTSSAPTRRAEEELNRKIESRRKEFQEE